MVQVNSVRLAQTSIRNACHVRCAHRDVHRFEVGLRGHSGHQGVEHPWADQGLRLLEAMTGDEAGRAWPKSRKSAATAKVGAIWADAQIVSQSFPLEIVFDPQNLGLGHASGGGTLAGDCDRGSTKQGLKQCLVPRPSVATVSRWVFHHASLSSRRSRSNPS